MDLLLDTHAFLWFVTGDKRLSRKARHQLSDDQARLFISVASVWEMAIKVSLDRLGLPTSLTEYISEKLQSGFHLFPVEWRHAAAVSQIPFHHRDPFDRLLIAQSIQEEIPIVSADVVFRKYPVKVIW